MPEDFSAGAVAVAPDEALDFSKDAVPLDFSKDAEQPGIFKRAWNALSESYGQLTTGLGEESIAAAETADQPLVKIPQAAVETVPTEVGKGIAQGIKNLTEGMTTPANIIAGAATAVAPEVGLPIFAGLGAKAAGESAGAASVDIQQGNVRSAAQESTEALGGAAIAALSAKAALARKTLIQEAAKELGIEPEPSTPAAAPADLQPGAEKTVPQEVKQAMEEQAPTAPIAQTLTLPGPVEDRIGVTPAGAAINSITAPLASLPAHIEGTLRTISGETMPKTTLANNEAGQAGARYGSTQVWAPFAAEQMSHEVLPEGSAVNPEKFGAALTEDALRGRRKFFQRAANDALSKGDLKEAERFQDAADAVKTVVGPNSPIKTEAELLAFTSEPEVQAAVERHNQLYASKIDPLAEEAGLDTSAKPTGGGLFPKGAFVNLFVPQEGGVLSRRTTGTVNPIATMKRGSRFSLRRSGASEKYGVNYHDMIANAFGGFAEVARKNEFDKALVDAGLAVIGKDRPGDNFTFFPYERRKLLGLEENQVAWRKTVNKNIWVRNDIAREYETVSNLYRNPFSKLGSNIIGNWVNRYQMLGLLDATYHTRALVKGLLEAPLPTGADPVISSLRLDVLPKAARLVKNFFLDQAEKRSQLTELANIGALSQHAAYSWKAPVKSAVRFVEENVRLTLGQMFDELAKEGRFVANETNKREFVNRGLQYNKRFQGPIVRALRQSAIGPFVTAGRAGLARGIRRYALTDWARPTTLPNRAWIAVNVLSKAAGTALLVGIANQLRTSTWTGRTGTPIGTVDTGTDDKNGAPIVFDLTDMLGNEMRGARAFGLRALVEGKRVGLSNADIADSMVRESANALLHPMLGPMPQAGWTALTGERLGVGLPGAPKVLEGSQALSNVKTAAEELNPYIAAGIERLSGKEPAAQAGKRTAQALGVKTGQKPETVENLPEIVHGRRINDFVEWLAKEARKKPMDERKDFIDDQLEPLDREDEKRVKAKLKRSGVLKYE